MNIIIQNVSLSYDSVQILDNISIKIEQGDFLGIIGPNGSGKSTLLKCVYRVLNPSSGDIYFDDTNINKLSYKESALKLAVVAQHNAYSFDFKVIDVVLMGRTPHKKLLDRDSAEDYKLAKEAIRKVGLEGFENRMINTLSGGEQQRVVLARALTQCSDCLVLDEPTNHLDIKYQLELLDTVKSLNNTVVAAIHDLNIAALYCNKLIAIKDGIIVGEGTPRELLTPLFIKDLYGVDAEVTYNEDKQMLNIIYIPLHYQSKIDG